ncbi:MAG: hypothetical protein KBF24_10400 [Thiobacillaceae bacterium]|jgi:cytochrome c553|nr:hypothetical protein [Hydrogenophilales bacterium]MBP8902943.1 hypothetical protein [Thiobacillaceae bacterium]MBP9916608.1 hypothetical protein [Thiobacillaceae bacterium]
MKTLTAALSAIALVAAMPVLAGDPVAGKQKATACVLCHGSENFGGIFYTLQLAGRNADKLAIKTNKYKTLKVLHPMMNMATAFYTEKEIEDVSAYYQSIGKPFFTSPLFTIKGDDEAKPAAAAAVPAPAAPYAVAAK